MEGLYLSGLIALSVFYALILLVGLLAACKAHSGMQGAVLANRNIGILIGAFAMTATWVGGDFINDAAQSVYDPSRGLLWAQVPFSYALSLLIGGTLFAKRIHSKNCITMLDPLQHQFGLGMGSILFIPALFGEILWSAAILSTVGSAARVVLGMDQLKSIVASACVTALYTAVGGLTSVMYTAVLQLLCMLVGLWLIMAFALTNDAVTSFTDNYQRWMGIWSVQHTGVWLDTMLMLTFGRVPWQGFFQRILATSTPARAQILSITSAVWCLIMAVPPILIGAIAASTDWSQASQNETSEYITSCITTFCLDKSLVVPVVLRHLTPEWVSLIGLVTIAASVMSSIDSSFLAASSMFAHNVHKMVFRPMAYETEVLRVMRISIFFLAACTAAIALQVKSVYSLWYLSADIPYVTLFPQIFCALYFRSTNKYGSFVGFIVGLALRIVGGEPTLNIPVLLEFPFYSPIEGQLFPFKTLAMLASIFSIIIVSYLLKLIIETKALSPCLKFLGCLKQRKISRGSYVNELIDMADETLNGKVNKLRESDV